MTSSTRIPPDALLLLDRLAALLDARGVQAYLVGGFIRDTLLGVPTRDVDLAVDGDCLALGRELADTLGGAYVLLDETHQVARIVLADGWRVDLAAIQGGSIRSDLGRRDFSIDAMALPLAQRREADWPAKLLDPYNGRGDLARKQVRALRPLVFDEDPVRLLRAPRIAARLGFAIEAATERAIVERASLIQSVVGERVRDEFMALLSMDLVGERLRLLDRLGLLCQVVPELAQARGVGQPKEHYWDVFNHSVEAAAFAEAVTSGRRDGIYAIVPWDDVTARHFAEQAGDGYDRRTILKLAALLHDIAKPQTKAPDETGRIRFLGHQEQGAQMAEAICQRLRLSGRSVRMVSAMLEHHLRPTQMAQGAELPTARAVYRYFRDLEDVAVDTLYLCLADYLAAKGPALDVEDWKRHVRIVEHILKAGLVEQPPAKTSWLVNGHDLMEALGLAPGPTLGVALDAVHEAQAVGEVASREEALEWASRYVRKTGVAPR